MDGTAVNFFLLIFPHEAGTWDPNYTPGVDFLGVFKILEKYNLRERWKQVSEILERWKQVFRNLREIFPKSSFQNLREIVISERWKQIPEILERWKQVPEIACNITHDYYSL